MKKIFLVFLAALVFIAPNFSFGQVRGLLNILRREDRNTIVKNYFKQKEKAEKEEVARLYKYILTTQTNKYLPSDWRTRTPKQQLLILQTHIQWLKKITDEGFLNPEEYFRYIARQNANKENDADDVMELWSGNVTKDIKINEKIKKEIMGEIERRGYKGTQIRFDFDDGYRGIELVIVRLVYKGKDYGLTKGGLGIGGVDKDGADIFLPTKDLVDGFEMTAQEIIKKKTAPKRP